jgi:hypothetical protein
MFLEFASFWLACRFWSDNNGRRKVLALFLCCQCLPVMAVFYDCRYKDFIAEKNRFDKNKAEVILAVKTSINGIMEQFSAINSDLDNLKNDSNGSSLAINQILMSKRKRLDEALRAEVNYMSEFRKNREREISTLIDKRKKLSVELDTEGKSLMMEERAQFPYQLEIEYITTNMLSANSCMALFIAIMFPIAQFGVSYIQNTKNKIATHSTPHFDLVSHMEKVAVDLPPEMHANYVKSLVPLIDAHFTMNKASRELTLENDRLHLEHAMICDVMDRAHKMSSQIASSKLEESAKNQMVETVKQMLNNNL